MKPVSIVIIEEYAGKTFGMNNILRMHLSTICVSTFLILVSSCDDSTNTLSPLSPDSVILAFGNSLTYGTGANKTDNYPSRLSKLTNLKVINEGIPGEITHDGLKRLPNILDEHDPDLVILMHGANDIMQKLSKTNLKNNLLQMIQECHDRNIEVIALAIPGIGISLKPLKLYEEVGTETNIPVELKLVAYILKDRSLKSDIVHPNSNGYKVLAEGIYDFLIGNGAIIK